MSLFEQWELGLTRYSNGVVIPNMANVIEILRACPDWVGTFGFNELSQEVETMKESPIGLRIGTKCGDHEDRLVTIWMQQKGFRVNDNDVGKAIRVVAKDIMFHPIRDYLKSIPWDGEKRIGTWLMDYAGVEDTPLNRAFGEKWLISAVARVMKPGCKADCCLILEGPQGSFKSTLLRILAVKDNWFTDEVSSLGGKEASMQLMGKWIIELSELDALRKGEVASTKSFISRTADHFRPPYGKSVMDFERQCVFAGTVNDYEYLKDETGGRRFWPVKIATIDAKKMRQGRTQLWAEALASYLKKETWWLSREQEELARIVQAERFDEGPWHEEIMGFLEEKEELRKQGFGDGSVSITEILQQLERPNPSQTDRLAVRRSLVSVGYEQFRVGSTRTRRYRPKDCPSY